jgi:DNA-directed RNA polymerase specialized sigma24 family protein
VNDLKRLLNDVLAVHPDEVELKPTARQRIEKLLSEIPDGKVREALQLRYLQGARWPTLCVRLNLKDGQVHQLIFTGLGLLRQKTRSIRLRGVFTRKAESAERKASSE